MKKFFKIVLIVLIWVVIIFGGLAIWAKFTIGPIAEDAKGFNRDIVTKLAQDWDWSVITPYEHEAMKKAIEHTDMNKVQQDSRDQLGKLVSVSETDCNIVINYNPAKHVLAGCYLNGKFEKDDATVTTNMEKIGDNWQIIGINFNRKYVKK